MILIESLSAVRAGAYLHHLRLETEDPAKLADFYAAALDRFEVVCHRTGVTLEITSDMSILETLEEADIPIMGSCYEGVCGTCEARVLEGTPDHRDSVLSDAEKDAGEVMLVCVSRSRTERLVLDL